MDAKFIVDRLTKPPFNKSYTLVTFDALQHDELLQVLSDILGEIGNGDRIEIQLEDPEQTTRRLLNSLRVLNYKPSSDIDTIEFKRGLIEGDKRVLRPILKWLLSNLYELKNRAYLAKYLVRINVPNDVLGDSDIAVMYDRYLKLIDEFTKTHKQSIETSNNNNNNNNRNNNNNSGNTSELISDCGAIEREKELVMTRIEILRKKVESISDGDRMLKLCRRLRIERDAKKETTRQTREELALLQRARQQINRLNERLRESKTNPNRLSSTDQLLTNLEQETYVISYLAERKLPSRLNREKNAVKILSTIVDNANSNGNNNINNNNNNILQTKATSLVEQISTLKSSSSNNVSNFNNDDSIGIVAAGVKDNLATKFFELKITSQRLANELQTKRDLLRNIVRDSGMASGEEFRDYVKQLRARSLIYKSRRGDLALVKNEVAILSRTAEKLRAKKTELLGISDDEQYDENNNNNDNNDNDEDILRRIGRLNKDIGDLKSRIIPSLRDEYQPSKEDYRQTRLEYDERKRLYDKTSTVLDGNLATLRREYNLLRENYVRILNETHLFEAKTIICRTNLERANNEIQMQTDNVSSTPTLRERYHRKITESERTGKLLTEHRKRITVAEGTATKRKELWTNLKRLLNDKRKALQDERAKNGIILRLEKGSETLVLSN